MAKMLVEAFDLAAVTEGEGGNWANGYIETLINKNITSMDSIDSFKGNEFTKRGHLVKFVYLTEIANGDIGDFAGISNETITLGGTEYSLSDEVKGVLKPQNREVLQNADISIRTDDTGTITEVLQIKINANGTASEDLSQNVVFDGGNADVKNLIVDGDYVTVENVVIDGD